MCRGTVKMRSKNSDTVKVFFSPLNFSCFSLRNESFSALINLPVNEILKWGRFALLSSGSSRCLLFGEWPQSEDEEREVQDSFMCLMVVASRQILSWLCLSSALPLCVFHACFFGNFRHSKYWWVVCCSQAKCACKLLPATSKCGYKTLGVCLCSLSRFKNLCHILCLGYYNKRYSWEIIWSIRSGFSKKFAVK